MPTFAFRAPTELIAGEIFNAGYENHSVDELGQFVVDVIGDDVEVVKTPTDDNRSYHVSSEKIKRFSRLSPNTLSKMPCAAPRCL